MSQPIAWTEVRVLVPLGWQELVAETIALGPCTTAAFGRPSLATDEAPEGSDWVRTFIPDHADSPALRTKLGTALLRLAKRSGVPELAGLVLEYKTLPPEDYATSWKKSWKPFRLRRLCLLPPWQEYVLRPHELRLTLEPGGAFGTGRHATTRTCLKVLEERIAGGERVLDAGCGSGILSVAALLLGAEHALGFDIDVNAIVIAEDLARDNRVEAGCRFRAGGFECLGDADKAFDVVLANIYSDIISEFAPSLRTRLAPDGWFAFSGCPVHHADETRVAIRAAGLRIDEERVRGRWHTFVGSHS